MTGSVQVIRGDSPVVLGLPHTGTDVPATIEAKLNARGRALADTDWHIHTLYEGLLPGATTVRATFHRYVIDANRDPSGVSLYPGQNTTTLVPLTDFDGQDIWDILPTEKDIVERREAFHAPYHAALRAELERVKAIHGIAVLYDCHSIRGHIPFLFDGILPDLNIGTNNGVTCAPAIEAISHEFASSSPYSTILNGRFKGGWTTRHYGNPAEGIHAIQMELAQSTYLSAETAPWTYDTEKANRLRRWLKDILDAIQDTALEIAA
ncbi:MULTISPECIES: N-formylglutamate deformylase [unclassified Ruegeria]|uniref:N-formylglutamate deformylase n=1 Tax=unclassified Ruegeria TaxID=2625375 RepID=UPI0014885BD8|nr:MULTISPECIES: N-formylglutamate deformylase [unclassified Ruegeria]NOD34377.1 N-formylglutamate deformylase [Ruegeria sp. HKCCD7296]NOD47497.1 N-formylglutamate deformylase [Ruegeria sp. HKCCD5849]NOD53110.1 N-formylglutamate deformylase [Ruegeria sp. HKCCD5851]NOD66303.1 N-formylglutamate deformylase [Ruegeria sp. HKCCD7303]NOE34208.1 N-formylglutamate deformylase [Ruegeria sp. HKCCD7318]